jgi:nitroreductase
VFSFYDTHCNSPHHENIYIHIQFLPWYAEAIDSAQQAAIGFQNLVKSRRTVHKFDATEVDDGVLRRALECAIAAPNRRGTEPWRFIKLGKETVGKVNALRQEMRNKKNDVGYNNSIDDAKAKSNAEFSSSSSSSSSSSGVAGSFVSWTNVPHWIVVTYARAPPNSGPEGKIQQREDFKSTCCAVQNFLLSMWSEGIGTKWTDGPVQRTEVNVYCIPTLPPPSSSSSKTFVIVLELLRLD